MIDSQLQLHVGIKSDPVEYRFTYEWLFRILAEEGIHHVQLGSFFELYQLPDDFFLDLRRQAELYDVQIASLFTSHRELGGFFRDEHPAWQQVAKRNYRRLIQVGVLLGARSVGSNPGAAMRDRIHLKQERLPRYLDFMKEMMHFAHEQGMNKLTIEVMSCLAEPPTLPEEIRMMAEELLAYHRRHPHTTASVGYCVDVAHGYADRDQIVRWDNMQLLQVSLPYLDHLHLKNTDRIFDATFGFSAGERQKGIVQIPQVRDLLLAQADVLPVSEVIGYLEIGGPKRGRDYSDWKLEDMLRQSLRYLRQTFRTDPESPQERAA